MELSGVVPLPVSVVRNRAAGFAALPGGSPLVRAVRVLADATADQRRVIVAAAEPLVGDVRETLASEGFSSVTVLAVAEPADRFHCLSTAVASLTASHVLVHDISRPLASAALCLRVIDGLGESGAAVVVPAVAVTDSIKEVDARGAVTRTVDRSLLRAAQYPRGFATNHLRRLLAGHASGEFDELALCSRAGVPVMFVDGEPDAFYADLPRDASYVEAIIASRH